MCIPQQSLLFLHNQHFHPILLQVADAKVLEIPNDRTDTYVNAIRQQIGSHLQLVVTIFPTSRDDRYSALKKLCCIESPVPSQVC